MEGEEGTIAFKIKDNKSTNKTYVDDVVCTPLQWYDLHNNSIVSTYHRESRLCAAAVPSCPLTLSVTACLCTPRALFAEFGDASFQFSTVKRVSPDDDNTPPVEEEDEEEVDVPLQDSDHLGTAGPVSSHQHRAGSASLAGSPLLDFDGAIGEMATAEAVGEGGDGGAAAAGGFKLELGADSTSRILRQPSDNLWCTVQTLTLTLTPVSLFVAAIHRHCPQPKASDLRTRRFSQAVGHRSAPPLPREPLNSRVADFRSRG